MPHGKPAGQRCIHLDPGYRCTLFGDPRRPAACRQFLPEPAVCGGDRAEALANLTRLEQLTAPATVRFSRD
jgi:hypothetical protein